MTDLKFTSFANIVDADKGNTFYHISNSDGKEWLVPKDRMQTALCIYQPSGWKGKLMKSLFPYLYWNSLICKTISAKKVQCHLKSELFDVLDDLFHADDLWFSFFGGTPSVHKKITMQLNENDNIIAYCKLSNDKNIVSLFEKETIILDILSKKGVSNIPKVLYMNFIDDSVALFVQDTTKTIKSKSLHKWSFLHQAFLDNLHAKTKQELPFEKSDFYTTLVSLKSHIDYLPKYADKLFISNIIDDILLVNKNKTVEYSVYHGDFTPWNMFFNDDEIFVFDWEYASLVYPKGLDRYHFFTQTFFLEKHKSLDELLLLLQSDECNWVDRKEYVFYLIDVISRFSIREKGDFQNDISKMMKIWITLLEFLYEKDCMFSSSK